MDERSLDKFFQELDRSLFIEGPGKSMAKVDAALPIGHGQTISQPSLVVAMTRHLDPKPSSCVLEIGTGSGYQTAFLAQFSKQVYTVERISTLQEQAKERLAKLGFDNIQYRHGDGSEGWPEKAPFDRIMVTAAAGQKPQSLIDQLAKNGRMLIPVGSRGMQELLLIRKDRQGRVQEKSLEAVVFVEFVGRYGF